MNAGAAVERPEPIAGSDSGSPLLAVQDLHVELAGRRRVVHVAHGVNYELREGETLAVLGESGSGKSITARAIMDILPPGGRVTSGRILFRGQNLLELPAEERRGFRGARIAMVFQDALSALNPVLPVGTQIGESFRVHRGMSRAEAKREAVRLLDRVKIPGAARRVGDYPHQFSGGMRQRVMIAIAIAMDPQVLIADEPTTALDVTVQAQIMSLLAELQRERRMGLILITHDMGVIADVADRVAVMYAGRVVERASTAETFGRPAHPYTRALLESIPRPQRLGKPLSVIRGAPPDLSRLPQGCSFAPRCPLAIEVCRSDPPLYVVEGDRVSACHRWQEVLKQ